VAETLTPLTRTECEQVAADRYAHRFFLRRADFGGHPHPDNAGGQSLRSLPVGGVGDRLSIITNSVTPPLPTARNDSTPNRARRELYRTRNALRPVQGRRVAQCGKWVAGDKATLSVSAGGGGRASWSGLNACGAVHVCPTCRARICSRRAAEVSTAVSWWRAHGAGYFETLRAELLAVEARAKRLREWLSFPPAAAKAGAIGEREAEAATLEARAIEIRSALAGPAKEGPEAQPGVAMLTLTIRHGAGDDLRELRRGLANAWRGVARGRPWQKFKAKLGIRHSIRALEVTHGDNGFHPHLHVLLFLDREMASLSEDHVAECVDWLKRRWGVMVDRYLGAGQHGPSYEHGLSLDTGSDDGIAHYICKLGLQMSDPGFKTGSSEHKTRTMMELAGVVARWRPQKDTDGSWRPCLEARRDYQTWRAYSDGIKGAAQLTWSRGLKAASGVKDATDGEIVAEDEAGAERVAVADVDRGDWGILRRLGRCPLCRALGHWRVCTGHDGGRHRTIDTVPVPVLLLEHYERGGLEAFRTELRRALRGQDGGRPDHDAHKGVPQVLAGL
jgi:hypothetical protein